VISPRARSARKRSAADHSGPTGVVAGESGSGESVREASAPRGAPDSAQASRGWRFRAGNSGPDRSGTVAGPPKPELGEDALPGYRCERLLAQSSRFEVHRAWSAARSVPVAVKFARPSAGADAVQKLAAETRLLAGLAHPNLVRAYEAHRAPHPALVLELLPGPTLGELFRNHGRLKVTEAVQMGRQVGSAWAICTARAGCTATSSRTTCWPCTVAPWLSTCRWPVDPAGTPKAMAPRAIWPPSSAGRRPRVSPATDVWALGLLLLEALTGRDPYPPKCAEYRDGYGPLAVPPPDGGPGQSRPSWPNSSGPAPRTTQVLARNCLR